MAEKRNKKKAKKRHPEADPLEERDVLDELDQETPAIEARAVAYARLMTVEERLYKLWEERSSGKMDWLGEAPRRTSISQLLSEKTATTRTSGRGRGAPTSEGPHSSLPAPTSLTEEPFLADRCATQRVALRIGIGSQVGHDLLGLHAETRSPAASSTVLAKRAREQRSVVRLAFGEPVRARRTGCPVSAHSSEVVVDVVLLGWSPSSLLQSEAVG
ncbi:MAG TPA: hypothetical protein VIM18_02680 [Solirubrobacteraceae bacterium]